MGHAELLTLPPSSTVQDLRTTAQRAFGKKYLRLITAKNRVLVNFEQTLEEAEIEDGECLTALVLQPQLAATTSAFALWCQGDSAIVAWGNAHYGGDNSTVQDQLRGVQQIIATRRAFAAILADASVVTWRPGVRQTMAVTVRRFEISSGVCSVFTPLLPGPLLRFWQMDQSLPGVLQKLVLTVREFKISSLACSRLKSQLRPLQRFWQMDLL